MRVGHKLQLTFVNYCSKISVVITQSVKKYLQEKMYPKVKVRVQREDDDQYAYEKTSLQSLKAFEWLSLNDSSSSDDSPRPVVRVPRSYVPLSPPPSFYRSKDETNKKSADAKENQQSVRAISAPRPRAVLSSPAGKKMSSDSMQLLIKDLQIDQKSFNIRLRILRVGHEITCGKNSSTRVRKLIMMDNEGVQIGVTIFNDDNNYFVDTFKTNKTYLITNGEVRRGDPRYSIHPNKELILKKFSVVKEEPSDTVEVELQYKFVEFKDVQQKIDERELFDISGTLVQVEESKVITTKDAGALKTLRNILVVNKKSEIMKICLWEDLAKNEGKELQQVVKQKPNIAITNVYGKRQNGDLEFNSTMKSVVQILPTCQELEPMQHSCDINDPLRFNKLAVIQRMRRSKEVTLKDLKENRHMLSEDDSYYFKGIVDKITNKSSIWYDACKKCNKSCRKSEGITMCGKCNEEFVETTPRYRITTNVIESGYNARVTMFDEVATLYVGCPVKKYISSISEGENDSKYYRDLNESTEICFITALNLLKIDGGGNLYIIANGIQKMQSTENIDAEEESKKDEEEDDKAKCTKVGRKKKIATKAQEESKLKDEEEEDKTPVEMSKCTKVERKKKITTKAQPKEVQDKKRRRDANKNFDDYIEIPSDDEVPLAKLISESKKNKSHPLKKIKQENEGVVY